MGTKIIIDIPPEIVEKLHLLAQRLGYTTRAQPDTAEGSIAWLLRLVCEEKLIILPKSFISLWSSDEQGIRNTLALDKVKEAIRILAQGDED